MRRSRLLSAVAALVLVVGCGSSQATAPATGSTESSPAEASADRLLGLLRDRLQIMTLVARAKWNAKLPVEDKRREAELVARMRGRALAHGLSPDWTETFFRAQIEAGKDVQRALIDAWTKSAKPMFANAPDLRGEIRPRIDALNDEILVVLGEVTPLLDERAVQAMLRQRGPARLASQDVSTAVANRALAPLLRAR